MEPQLFILTQIHDACRRMILYDDWGSPTWSDGQFFRTSSVRLERRDAAVWQDFLQRMSDDRELALAVRAILVDRFIVMEEPETNDVQLNLPSNVLPFTEADREQFLRLLDVWGREKVLFPGPWASVLPDLWPHLCTFEYAAKFIPPSKESKGEIMYIEKKLGLTGSARIGRVRFSKTRKTIYYDGKKLQSLRGSGIKANYYDVESAMWYWISRCKKNGADTLYSGIVEIDDDVREEYWTEIRKQPEKNI